MTPIAYKELTIGTFYVRGLVKIENKDLFVRDVGSYNIVCCLKIKVGLTINIGVRQYKSIAWKQSVNIVEMVL